MQVGLDKVAAYREEDGTLKTWSAVCPHLKCSVMYNPKDNTFDCPCHGSHFDTNGDCINGACLGQSCESLLVFGVSLCSLCCTKAPRTCYLCIHRSGEARAVPRGWSRGYCEFEG